MEMEIQHYEFLGLEGHQYTVHRVLVLVSMLASQMMAGYHGALQIVAGVLPPKSFNINS